MKILVRPMNQTAPVEDMLKLQGFLMKIFRNLYMVYGDEMLHS
jgi:hypothetical protein